MVQSAAENLVPSAAGDVVTYSFTCPEAADDFQVRRFVAREQLNRPYEVEVDLDARDEVSDGLALVGKSAFVTVERAHFQRSFAGIVRRVTLQDTGQVQQSCRVELVPALFALASSQSTRIFQSKTALEIVMEVLRPALAPYDRDVDISQLSATYQTRDFCVQYRESDMDFVHRLMEEEGIGYHFEHSEEEQLVLFDSNQSISALAPKELVAYDPSLRNLINEEPIIRFSPIASRDSRKLVVRDHDWTCGRPTLEQASELEDREQEVYEHGLGQNATITEDEEGLATMVAVAQGAAQLIYENAVPSKVLGPAVPGLTIGNFTSDDSERQLGIRQELLDRDRSIAEGASMLVGLSPGRRFSLAGHPTLGADGDYFAVRVTHRSDAPEAAEGIGSELTAALQSASYHNEFECLPYGAPWRPERQTPKPRIHGIQTATVVGPMGMNVHTDQHGRIKVKFNWDRSPRDLGGSDSAWIRVGQVWAGNNAPGFSFIPRVGMEVIVSFVDGDPDRPLVMGCVHNGQNATPGPLPLKATKSVIRTRTIPHGVGYNEISFEDAMGMEQVHIRAQGDLTENVLKDHRAVINGSQSTVVRTDQRTVVEGIQNLHVMRERHKSVYGNESSLIGGRRHETVKGSSYRLVGQGEETVVNAGDRFVPVRDGRHILTAREVVAFESVSSVETLVGNASIRVTDDAIVLEVGGSIVEVTAAGIRLNQKTIPVGSA